jgi:deoxycytidine triphosphate deaminase
MYLSDRDLRIALLSKQLIVEPMPTEIDTTGFDVHLDHADEARVWDVAKYLKSEESRGGSGTLKAGRFRHRDFAKEFEVPVPKTRSSETRVYRVGDNIVMRPGGFFLWQTKEVIGTPEVDPRFICFIDGKSTRARTGLLVHMTAPTISSFARAMRSLK